MAIRSTISVPTSILAEARFDPTISAGYNDRPSGTGLTGGDLAMFYVVLDAAGDADGDNVVYVPQTRFTDLCGKVHPKRIEDALKRLHGTDMLYGNHVAPCMRFHQRHVEKRQPRIWAIQMDHRVVEFVRKAIKDGTRTNIDANAMRPLSSRLSVILWSRWMAWLDGSYPDLSIGFQRAEDLAAFMLDVPADKIGSLFGIYGNFAPSITDRLIITKSTRSPLKHEMVDAGIACDITKIIRTGFDDRWGIRIQMTTMDQEGFNYLTAHERHIELKRRIRRERMMPRRPPAPTIDTN